MKSLLVVNLQMLSISPVSHCFGYLLVVVWVTSKLKAIYLVEVKRMLFTPVLSYRIKGS